MSIFSAIGKLGLGNFENSRILGEDENEKRRLAKEKEDSKTPEEREQECLFDRVYKCPICDFSFKTKCVRTGHARLIDKDTDLRPIYEHIDVSKYDVIACDKCGYASLGRFWGKLATRQARAINSEIASSFTGIDTSEDKGIFSYEDAIVRYQLALVTTMVKHAKSSERAYTCLKYAWTLRGYRKSLGATGDPANTEKIKSLYADEQECIQNAYEGFVAALSKESFPIVGMDEMTMNYLLGDLARRLGKYEEALRFVAAVITSRTANQRIKDKALELKELIRENAKAQAAKS